VLARTLSYLAPTESLLAPTGSLLAPVGRFHPPTDSLLTPTFRLLASKGQFAYSHRQDEGLVQYYSNVKVVPEEFVRLLASTVFIFIFIPALKSAS
jgi:hypothetical protein